MIYFVENLPQRKITHEQLDQALVVADDILQLPEDTIVEITFVSGVERCYCGDADVEDGVAQITINQKLRKKDLIVTLFHEMVHIKQIIDGRLSIGEGRVPSKWDGEVYNGSYEELPWEEEAFRMEQHIMNTFEEKTNGIHRTRR